MAPSSITKSSNEWSQKFSKTTLNSNFLHEMDFSASQLGVRFAYTTMWGYWNYCICSFCCCCTTLGSKNVTVFYCYALWECPQISEQLAIRNSYLNLMIITTYQITTFAFIYLFFFSQIIEVHPVPKRFLRSLWLSRLQRKAKGAKMSQVLSSRIYSSKIFKDITL